MTGSRASWRGGWGFGEFQAGREHKLLCPDLPLQPCLTHPPAGCNLSHAPASLAAPTVPLDQGNCPCPATETLLLGSQQAPQLDAVTGGEGRMTAASAVVCGSANPDFQRAEASQDTCNPGMVGFQGSTTLSSNIPCIATFCWAARRNQPNGSSAPAEGYRAKAELCPAFSRTKLPQHFVSWRMMQGGALPLD